MRIEFTLIDDKGQTFIGSTDLRPGKTSASTKGTKKPIQETPKKLPDYILDLRNAGVFQRPTQWQ